MADSAESRKVRKWILGSVAAVLALAGVTAYVALKTEESVRESFQKNLVEVAACYEEFEAARSAPPDHPEKLFAWLTETGQSRPDLEKLIRSGRVKVAWGERLPGDSERTDAIFAFTTDPPVRGRRPAVMFDGSIRWLTRDEFKAAQNQLASN
jgi:hypothetical protein